MATEYTKQKIREEMRVLLEDINVQRCVRYFELKDELTDIETEEALDSVYEWDNYGAG